MERTKHGEFTWVDLSTRDFEGQSAFYEALFGWERADMPAMEGMVYRLFKADGHTVTGAWQLPADMMKQGVHSAWNTCVATDDVDVTAARAAELGGAVVMPPMDVPGPGRQAVILDPAGAQLFLWRHFEPDETVEYLRPGRLSWNDLTTREPEKAAAFYAALFGWEIEPMTQGPTPYWQVKVDGQGEGGIMPMPETMPAEVPPYWLVYFGTEDAAMTAAKAVELGGTVLVEPTEVPGMLIFAVVADPAGATFAVLQGLVDM